MEIYFYIAQKTLDHDEIFYPNEDNFFFYRRVYENMIYKRTIPNSLVYYVFVIYVNIKKQKYK